MRAVLAEDSLLLREGLVRLLDEAGCEVVAAVDDGDAAVAAVVEHRPDVAVLDVRMPPSFTDEGLRAAGAGGGRGGPRGAAGWAAEGGGGAGGGPWRRGGRGRVGGGGAGREGAAARQGGGGGGGARGRGGGGGCGGSSPGQ